MMSKKAPILAVVSFFIFPFFFQFTIATNPEASALEERCEAPRERILIFSEVFPKQFCNSVLTRQIFIQFKHERQVLRAAKCASLRWSSDAHRRWKAGQVLPRSASTRFISLSLCRVTTPTQLMCVDEQRIPFPGQSPSRKYLQSKPNPVSPKDFVLATPQSLVLDFKIYTGKENVPAKCQKEIGWS